MFAPTRRNHCSGASSNDFCNKIGQVQTSRRFTAIRGKRWQEPRRMPARQMPHEAGYAAFATWRKTMGRPATQVATDGAFQIRRPLDALNFFLVDVRDGLGPYLAIYLLTVQKWDEA